MLYNFAAGYLACRKWCPRGEDVRDPYAEERYLLEKERTKIETISFCYDTCAKEWSQWESCTKEYDGSFYTKFYILHAS